MRVLRNFIAVAVLTVGSGVSLVSATDEVSAPKLQIRVVGRATSTVTGETLRLEDLADVSSPQAADDESVIALKKIAIGGSPGPGKEVLIQAASIVERLKAAQVDLAHVGYTFPREMSVTRAGRTISADEIRAAVESALGVQQRDITVKSIKYDESVKVLPGTSTILAQELFGQTPGQIPFMVTVKVPNAPDTRFRAVATAEEWREVPIATRPLVRGAVVESADIAMARLNTAAIPRDAADQPSTIVGLATSGNISFGEVFQRGKLAIPPVIVAGARITLVVKTQLLEATATGIALEPGVEGQEIRVRNEGSKKIVVGKVAGSTTVIVTPVGNQS